jgi:hypothetical protein
MNGFVAMQFCTLMGVDYRVGDFIPHEAVLPERAGDLIGMGVIANAPERQENHTIKVPVLAEEGTLYIELTHNEMALAIEAFQEKAENAILIINRFENPEALIIFDAVDSRKTVKDAARKRAEELVAAKAAETPENVDPSTEIDGLDTETAENVTESIPEETQEGGEA